MGEARASETPTVELAIHDRFPGDDEAEHRIALLRIHHAAERTQWELDSVGRALADYLKDPDPIYTGALLTGATDDLVKRLVALAAELRKSSVRLLPLAHQSYQAGK